MRARRIQKRRNPILWVVIISVIIVIIGGGWYVYIKTYGNNIMKLSTVDYLIITRNGEKDGKIVFIRTMKDKKIVYIVELPEYPFYGDKNIGFDSSDPSFGLQIIKQMFDIDNPDDSYFITLNKDKIKYLSEELGVSPAESIISLLKRLSKRKLEIFDFLKVQKIARELRLEGNMTYGSFYRLLSTLSNNAVMFDEIKGLTKNPILVKVGGKEYKRIYLSPDDVKRVQGVLH